MRGGFDLLGRIVEIALSAGREAMRYYGNCGDIDYKAEGSPLTAADQAAHRLIVRELEACTPVDAHHL